MTLPTPKQGRALGEFLRGCVTSDHLQLYDRLIEIWHKAGEPSTQGAHANHDLICLAPEFIVSAIADQPVSDKFLEHLKDNWDDKILPAISRMFSESRVHAWGCLQHPSEVLERIPDSLWRQVGYLDLEQSAVLLRGNPDKIYCNVRAFSFADSPEALGAVNGLNLSDAFCEIVAKRMGSLPFLDDGRVLDWRPFSMFNSENITQFERPMMSVAFERWTPNRDSQNFGFDSSHHHSERLRFPDMFRDLTETLLRWLRAGRISAWGTRNDSLDLQFIPQGVWSRPDVFVDFQYGRIAKLGGGTRTGNNTQLFPYFENISVGQPYKAGVGTINNSTNLHSSSGPRLESTSQRPTADSASASESRDSRVENESKRKGGRHPKWDWHPVHDAILSLANKPDGLPQKQATLIEFIMDQMTTDSGECPPRSTVRDWIFKFYPKTMKSLGGE